MFSFYFHTSMMKLFVPYMLNMTEVRSMYHDVKLYFANTFF